MEFDIPGEWSKDSGGYNTPGNWTRHVAKLVVDGKTKAYLWYARVGWDSDEYSLLVGRDYTDIVSSKHIGKRCDTQDEVRLAALEYMQENPTLDDVEGDL